MDELDWQSRRFEEHRTHLRAVAYRMLGSATAADDAIQEAWLRLSRADTNAVDNLGGWLTTVVARVCLDMLRSRAARREASLEDAVAPSVVAADGATAEQSLLLADSVGLAMLVVLDSLSPAERVAFVLHDMFDLSFDEISSIVGRSAPAVRQLASRARRRVRGRAPTSPRDSAMRRDLVDAFLVAAREGDFDALLAVLDPDVVVRSDAAAVRSGAPENVRGASAVAETFKGRARAAQLALVDGEPGLVWAMNGQPRVVFIFRIVGSKIVAIELIADPEHIQRLDLAVL
jgi:RNA polymerase sigma-70 factor (ECF subfamily)